MLLAPACKHCHCNTMARAGRSKRKAEEEQPAAEEKPVEAVEEQPQRVVRRRVAAAEKEELKPIEHASHNKVRGPACAPPAHIPCLGEAITPAWWPSSPGFDRQGVEDRAKTLPLVPVFATPALQVPGEVFVFGDGDCGQLGLGEEVTERLRPFPLSLDGKKVGAGSVDRRWSGQEAVLCPGQQDGRGRATRPSPLRAVPHTALHPCGQVGAARSAPVCELPPSLGVMHVQALQISCGGMHTVALTEDHHIFSWGVNDEGALGRETGKHTGPSPAF